jgi:transcription elongation factor GreB
MRDAHARARLTGMSKAFTREDAPDAASDDDLPPGAQALPAGAKNYVTPGGFARLRDEHARLLRVERPETVRTVSWAAANGDRSENGDYIYGKRRLREIDRRLRFLAKRLENAEIVDPARPARRDRVFFGATVAYADAQGRERVVSIVGADEADPERGRVSWISPIARALLKAERGDEVALRTPQGIEMLEVLEIRYETLDP